MCKDDYDTSHMSYVEFTDYMGMVEEMENENYDIENDTSSIVDIIKNNYILIVGGLIAIVLIIIIILIRKRKRGVLE